MNIQIYEDDKIKKVKSSHYNYHFDKVTGFFARWGQTRDQDPLFAPAPEILDLEISSGKCSQNCTFCYKENGGTSESKNMTLGTFKKLFDIMPKTLTQIAFGITDVKANPDFFNMMEYARDHGVIPNYTTSGADVDDEVAQKTKSLCGAVSISIHNKEAAFNAIKAFTDAGMTQVNVHWVLMEENYEDTFKIIDELTSDPRTKKMNAFVILAYKAKGRNKDKFHSIKNIEKYKELIQYCEEKRISYGFDSCSAPIFFKSVEGTDRYKQMSEYGEACESTLFSAYINVDGKFFPCSFNEEGDGLDVLHCADFTKDIWNHVETKQFRDKLLHTTSSCINCPSQKFCRTCPSFEVTKC